MLRELDTYHVAVDEWIEKRVGHAHPVHGYDRADVERARKRCCPLVRAHKEPFEGRSPEDS